MNKCDKVLELIHKHRPDVLALTEFGAGEEVQNGEINITGYTLYRKDHHDGKGGPGRGTVMYVNDKLNHCACPVLDNLQFDCATWCIIKVNQLKAITIGVVYRSPNTTELNNDSLIEMAKTANRVKKQHLLICGDFNFPSID